MKDLWQKGKNTEGRWDHFIETHQKMNMDLLLSEKKRMISYVFVGAKKSQVWYLESRGIH